MRAKFFVYCNRASASAVRLARSLGGKRIKRFNSKYKQKPQDVVINYGCGNTGIIRPTYQQPAGVRNAVSKMRTFDLLRGKGIPCPDYTQNKEQAQVWASNDKVLGRDLDRGSQGRGITVYRKDEKVGNHLFYVKYMKKEREFRYHVARGTVIHIAEKMRVGKEKRGPEYDPLVRSHKNGWVLAFNHLGDNPPPVGGDRIAVRAVETLGLDFGAVDMGYNVKDGFFVIEVNTAPGIEQTSLERYAHAFL